MVYFCTATIVICALMVFVSIGRWIMAPFIDDEYNYGQDVLAWIITLICAIAFTLWWKNKSINTDNIYLKNQRIIVTEKTDNQVVSSTTGNYEVYYNNNTATFIGEDGSSISFEFFEEN